MADVGLDTAYYTEMSPSLLAQQPVNNDSVDRKRKENSDWTVIFGKLEARLGMLRTWRYSWWWHWSILAEYFLPRRWAWLVVPNKTFRGNPINDAIIDSTGLLAVRTCAAGMWTGLTSPSRPWFTLEIGLPWVELDSEGKDWLEDTQERAYTVLADSNFYTTMAQAFQDVTVFGTAPVIIYEDFEDVIRCYLPTAGEYYLASGSRFSVDTLFREFNLTIAQIVEMFGIDNCPEQIRTLWADGGGTVDVEYVVAHAIEPNFAMNPRGGKKEIKVVPGLFTYREVYWLKGVKTDQPLSLRGFRTTPFMAARWATVSNEPYGRSPCMDALGDNKQVQLETRHKAEFIVKGVRPPMGANPELKNEPSSIVPGMITYMSTDNNKKGFWPLFEVNPAWLAGLTADIDKVNARIEKCLFVDLFMAISRMEGVQPRNELELTQRNLERLQELGPFIHMFENEFAAPALRRVLDIMMRRRMLKPQPASLQGVPIKINYVSIMKLAQNASESVSMKDVFATAGALSSAAKAAAVPDPIRIINLDKALREYGDRNNFPQNLWFTEGEVDEHDKAVQQAKAQQQMPGAAQAAVDAAKTLSETHLGGGTALGAMMGQQPGGAP
jgi:hypothetical protein